MPASASSTRVFQPTDTIAVVGNQHILAGDLLGEINFMLRQHIGQAPEEALNEQRLIAMKKYLPNIIDNKILYLEFLRKIPPDRLDEVRKNLDEEFDEQKLAQEMAVVNASSPAELDQILKQYGSSLEKRRRADMERKLGRAMLAREINYRPEVTHEEMLAYYHANATQFDVPARARYEQLTTRFSNHQKPEDPSGKAGAWEKLAAMGNEVLRGAKFDAVAQKHSEGSNAEQGGKSDWLTKGSLASVELDNAIFALPVGSLSAIIEDERGFHIIRVTEREEAHRTEFTTAQADIREKLKKQKIEQQVEEVLARLKAKTRVWTVFDEEAETRTALQAGGGNFPLPGAR